MSYFWRLLLGLLLAVSAGLIAQRVLSWAPEGNAPIPLLAIATSAVTRHQGQVALKALAAGGTAACLTELRPIEDSGLLAWIVTPNTVTGQTALKSEEVSEARTVLLGGSAALKQFSYRVVPVSVDSLTGALVLAVPALDSPMYLAARISVFVGIPVLACLVLARRFAKPLEEIVAAAGRLSAGDLSHRIGMASGPKEVVELGRSFDTMAQKLQEMMEAQKRLLSDISHEVRSPLGRIRMAAQMLSESKGDVATNIKRIQSDVIRLDELISALSGLTSPNRPLDRSEKFFLNGLVHQVVEEVSVGNRRVQVQVESDEVVVSANRPLLLSAITNVLQNAVRHSPESGLIEVKIQDLPARVTITDEGEGVPDEDLERIFEPFYRLSDARERDTGGVGLGLAIVRAIARAHGGDTFASPGHNGGLSVTIKLGSGPSPCIYSRMLRAP